eukprot:g2058.t1
MSATRLMLLMCCSTKTLSVQLLLGLGLLSHEARAQTTTRETASVSRVLRLGRENFDQIVFSEFEAVSTMVFFHTSWCAECKAPMQIWEQLATALHADPDSRSVQIAAVDCDRNWHLCQNFGIGEYPLVKVFHYRGDNRSKLVWRGDDDRASAAGTKEKDPQFQGTLFRFKDGEKFSGAELHKHALLLRKPCGFFTPRQCGAKEKKAIQEYAKLTLEGKEAKMRELAKEEVAGLEKRHHDLAQKTLEEEKVVIPERLRVEVEENEKYTRVIAAKREQLRRQAALEQKKASEELLRKQLGTTSDSSSAGAGDPDGEDEEDEDEEEDEPQSGETANDVAAQAGESASAVEQKDEEMLQPVAMSAEDEKLLKEVEKSQRDIRRRWKQMQKELRKVAKQKELAVRKKQLLKEGLARDAKAKRLHVRLEAGADGKETDSAAWVVVDLAKEALAKKAKQLEQELEDMDKEEDEDALPEGIDTGVGMDAEEPEHGGAPPSRVGKRGAPLSEGPPKKEAKSNGLRADKPAKPQAHRKNAKPKAEKLAKPRGDQKEASKGDHPAPPGGQGPSQKKTGTTGDQAQNTNKKAKKAGEKKKQPAVEVPRGEGITALHWGALGAGGETEQEQVPEPPITDPSQHHQHVPNKDETESDEVAKVAMEQMKAKVMEEIEKEEMKSKPPLFRAGDDEGEELEMENDDTGREVLPGQGLPEGFAKSSRKVKDVVKKVAKQKPKHEL